MRALLVVALSTAASLRLLLTDLERDRLLHTRVWCRTCLRCHDNRRRWRSHSGQCRDCSAIWWQGHCMVLGPPAWRIHLHKYQWSSSAADAGRVHNERKKQVTSTSACHICIMMPNRHWRVADYTT